MKPKVEQALNEQVQAEFFSFYLYLSMSAFFTARHLDGFAHWMRIQSQEEHIHAMKLFDFLTQRGGKVALLTLEAPQHEWSGPAEVIAATLRHEQYISQRINSLVDLALSEKDHATNVLLQWFVNEQVEEEATAETLLHQVTQLEGSPQGLLMLDRELALRPAPAAAGATPAQ